MSYSECADLFGGAPARKLAQKEVPALLGAGSNVVHSLTRSYFIVLSPASLIYLQLFLRIIYQ